MVTNRLRWLRREKNMTINQIKTIANDYAELFKSDEVEFFNRYQSDINNYTEKEGIMIIQLANLYYACKCGLIGRDETVKEQRAILEQ